MSLRPGSRLGPYAIVAPLGAGGMGEVWRAHDERLGRDVAIKVMSAVLADDPRALARFEDEARAVAALAHPNVVALHDVGRHDGVVYLVSELLQGESLRERLAQGPLPPRKAVEWATQIARGLAAAHDRGIVHRDLKPENVFVTRDGVVKILDFGLARRVDPMNHSGDDTVSPTQSIRTEPGTVLGTVGYMAPEQVRGEVADARADIFALGCILYEMLLGRRAFQRDTAAETMTAILREDPPELSSADRLRVPAAVERVLQHCLEKRPEDRFRDTRDLVFALESALVASEATAATRTLPVRAETWHRWLIPALLAVAVASAAIVALVVLRRPTTPAADAGPVVEHVARLTEAPGLELFPSLSPDGTLVAYQGQERGNFDIYVQRTSGHRPIDLTPDSDADDVQPAFSPDGQRIAFHSDRDGGGIYLMGATGESVRRLTDFGYQPAWSPDGRFLAVVKRPSGSEPFPEHWTNRGSDLSVIDAQNGQRRVLLEAEVAQPAWSPHGQRIAYGALSSHSWRDIVTVAATGGPPVPVTHDEPIDWAPTWSPSGDAIDFLSDRGGTMAVWRVPVDESTGRPRGAPRPLGLPIRYAASVAVARDGSALVVADAERTENIYRATLDATAARLSSPPAPVTRGSHRYAVVDVSPDGKWLALDDDGPPEDVLIRPADGTGGVRRLTDDPDLDRVPTFSPDGSRLLFISRRSGQWQVWTVRTDGSELRQVTAAPEGVVSPIWRAGGEVLAQRGDSFGFFTFDPSRPWRDQKPVPVDESALDKYKGVQGALGVSRDGLWVLQVLTDGGTSSLLGWNTRSGESGYWCQGCDVFPFDVLDGRRAIAATPDRLRLLLVDRANGQLRELALAPEGKRFEFARVAPDRRTLWLTVSGAEADIWLARLRLPGGSAPPSDRAER